MVIALGLHSRIDATHKYPMVQYTELSGNRIVPFGNGGDDNASYTAQRYRTIQPGMSQKMSHD